MGSVVSFGHRLSPPVDKQANAGNSPFIAPFSGSRPYLSQVYPLIPVLIFFGGFRINWYIGCDIVIGLEVSSDQPLLSAVFSVTPGISVGSTV
jgi:hypothetical protein